MRGRLCLKKLVLAFSSTRFLRGCVLWLSDT